MHEQSETVKRGDRWYNVYGKKTAKAGQVLKPKYFFERESYGSVGKAEHAARRRSEAYGRERERE